MAFLGSMSMVGSGLTAQQLRLDVISENVTNINTTRTEGGGAYRRPGRDPGQPGGRPGDRDPGGPLRLQAGL